jgi:hypothetical protein
MSRFAFNQVKLNNVLLTGIKSPNYDPREQESDLGADGAIHLTSTAIKRAAPKASFSTTALRTLIGQLVVSGATYSGLPYAALDGVNGISLIGNKIGTAPGWASGSVCAARKMLTGIAMLSGLEWSAGDVVRASLDVFGLSANGTSNPVDSTSIAAVAPIAAEQLALQSITIGGTDFTTSISSLRVNIEHKVENNVEGQCFSAGLPYPILNSMPGANGNAVITAEAEIADLTTAIANGDLVATFAVLTARGVGLSALVATCTLKTAMCREAPIAGEDGANSKRRVSIRATYDGSNYPITLAVA